MSVSAPEVAWLVLEYLRSLYPNTATLFASEAASTLQRVETAGHAKSLFQILDEYIQLKQDSVTRTAFLSSLASHGDEFTAATVQQTMDSLLTLVSDYQYQRSVALSKMTLQQSSLAAPPPVTCNAASAGLLLTPSKKRKLRFTAPKDNTAPVSQATGQSDTAPQATEAAALSLKPALFLSVRSPETSTLVTRNTAASSSSISSSSSTTTTADAPVISRTPRKKRAAVPQPSVKAAAASIDTLPSSAAGRSRGSKGTPSAEPSPRIEESLGQNVGAPGAGLLALTVHGEGGSAQQLQVDMRSFVGGIVQSDTFVDKLARAINQRMSHQSSAGEGDDDGAAQSTSSSASQQLSVGDLDAIWKLITSDPDTAQLLEFELPTETENG